MSILLAAIPVSFLLMFPKDAALAIFSTWFLLQNNDFILFSSYYIPNYAGDSILHVNIQYIATFQLIQVGSICRSN